MASKTGVNFFVNFHDLDPFAQKQCIYFTKKGKRCRWNCHENNRARVLNRRILASTSKNLSIEDMIEYVLCNCCTYDAAEDPFEKVEHRDSIEDAGLVLPLANRWKAEILVRLLLVDVSAKVTIGHVLSSQSPTSLDSSPASTIYWASIASTPNRDSIVQTPITDSAYYHTGSTASVEIIQRHPSKQTSPTPAPRASRIAAAPDSLEVQATVETSPCNNLLPQTSALTDRTSSLEDRYSHPPELEFRPHKARPSPKDTVSWMMRREPQRRDDESGFIYIFDRDGSPGHVKIGWTAVSVQQRLEGWSKHGYTPRLVFETERISNAQRAETLTHHELISEWRRELRCRNPECYVKHQEWFEVDAERAKQVVRDWKQWKVNVDGLDANGEAVTSKTMLTYYEALHQTSGAPVEDTSQSPPTRAIKHETVVEKPAQIQRQKLTNITQPIQASLVVVKKEYRLTHQETTEGLPQDIFAWDLRSTQNRFFERLKTRELTVHEPANRKFELETAKATSPKEKIEVAISKAKDEHVVVLKQEVLTDLELLSKTAS
jgi:hypothetical protein